jgi:hypothetical protein
MIDSGFWSMHFFFFAVFKKTSKLNIVSKIQHVCIY